MRKLRVNISVEHIDALLPQTQCGECGYNGCKPYAKAIVKHEAPLSLCHPGGTAVLKQLGKLCEEPIDQYLTEVTLRTKPKQLAVIDESLCIGCTKCIKACPVDAIIGTKKFMHSVLANECSGCELCVPPCPMDCIQMADASDQNLYTQQYRERFNARNQRLKLTSTQSTPPVPHHDETAKQNYIQELLNRKAKK